MNIMKIYLVLVFTSESKGANQNAVNQNEAALFKEYMLQRFPEGNCFSDTSLSMPQHVPINLIHRHRSEPYGPKTADTVKEFG